MLLCRIENTHNRRQTHTRTKRSKKTAESTDPNAAALDGNLLDVVDTLRVRDALHQSLHIPARHDLIRSEPQAQSLPFEHVVHQSNYLCSAAIQTRGDKCITNIDIVALNLPNMARCIADQLV